MSPRRQSGGEAASTNGAREYAVQTAHRRGRNQERANRGRLHEFGCSNMRARRTPYFKPPIPTAPSSGVKRRIPRGTSLGSMGWFGSKAGRSAGRFCGSEKRGSRHERRARAASRIRHALSPDFFAATFRHHGTCKEVWNQHLAHLIDSSQEVSLEFQLVSRERVIRIDCAAYSCKLSLAPTRGPHTPYGCLPIHSVVICVRTPGTRTTPENATKQASIGAMGSEPLRRFNRVALQTSWSGRCRAYVQSRSARCRASSL